MYHGIALQLISRCRLLGFVGYEFGERLNHSNAANAGQHSQILKNKVYINEETERKKKKSKWNYLRFEDNALLHPHLVRSLPL
jgi:hypothetical protein